MDRRKAELYEPSRQDLKDTECPYNDSDCCMALFNPVKIKLRTTRGYQIINDPPATFGGLRDRYRGLCLIKNRDGDPDKYIPLNFFGEIGLFKELPKADQIIDYTPYMSLNPSQQTKDEVEKPKNELIYSF